MTKGCAFENKIEHARFQALRIYYIYQRVDAPQKSSSGQSGGAVGPWGGSNGSRPGGGPGGANHRPRGGLKMAVSLSPISLCV